MKMQAIVKWVPKKLTPWVKKDQEYEIFMFYPVSFPHIFCWDKNSGHGDASLEYFHQCKKMDKETAQKYLDDYCKRYDCVGQIELRQRIYYKYWRQEYA